MQEEIIYAETGYRKKFIRILLTIAVIGVVVIAYLVPLAKQYLQQLPYAEYIVVVQYITLGIFIIPLLFSFFIIRYALVCLKQKRFPPYGAKVLKDTRVLYDENARKRSALLLFIATLLIVASIVGISFALILFKMLS